MRNTEHGQKTAAVSGAPVAVRWLVMAVELLIVILIAYQLAQVTFSLLEDDQRATHVVSPQVAVSQADLDLSRLTAFDPFFRQIAEAEAPVVDQGTVPESSLKLEVYGLRAGPDGSGSAIVRLQTDDQKLIKVGEEIGPGVRLVGVYADRLEVSRRGTREAVYLRPQGERQAAAAPVRPATSARRPAAQPPRPRAQPKSGSSEMAAQVAAAVNSLGLTPFRRNRRIVGFQMPENVPAMAGAMGLEAGDILLSINGVGLTSFERLEELSEELGGATQFQLEIERRGQTLMQAINLR